MDTDYTIKTSVGDLIVPFNVSDPNDWAVGETTTFEFEYPEFTEDLVVSSNQTLSGYNAYDSITVQTGVTLTLAPDAVVISQTLDQNGVIDQSADGATLITNGDAETALNEYMQWSGSYATQTMLDNTVKYRTQLPVTTTIDNLVWGVEPNQDLQAENVVGVWGLVEGVQNSRNQPLTINRYQVDVLVLGTIGEYSSENDVETTLAI